MTRIDLHLLLLIAILVFVLLIFFGVYNGGPHWG